jgi:Na+/proline symporter
MLNRAAALVHIDFAPQHRQPSWLRVLIASVAAIVGSLVADALLVVIGQALFPSTKGYVHFQFHDYAKLTVIGVIIACIGWPVVTRVSSRPRWLFGVSAVLVTLVLLLPDLYILHGGQPGQAVAVLMVMHVAIAVVTYYSLVGIAPVGPLPAGPDTARPVGAQPGRHAGHRA